MKKWLAISLAVVLLVGLMAACGSSTTPSTSASPEAESTPAPSPEESPAIPDNTVTGDPSAADAFVIWGWNTDFENIQKVIETSYPDLAKRIVFVNAGGSDYYQDKVDEILQNPDNELYPDMMLLEVDYVQKYVNSDYLMDVSDLGITSADMSNMYNYNIQLGTDAGGATRALFWQATPGSLQVRADLAEKYLGTTDPAELQEKYFSSWDKIIAAAKTVNETSGGKVKLFSGYSDTIRIFLNSARKVGWYDSNDVIQVDDLMVQYMDLAKTMYTDDSTYNTTQWGTDWAAQKDGDGVSTEAAIAFCGCPWYTYWCLTDTWENNTILVQGPAQFYWGGTGIAATVGCSDTDMASTLMKAITCDTDFMIKINAQNSDYVNNKEAIKYLLDNNLGNSSKMFGGQNLIEFYSESADNIDASTVTDVDQKTQSLFQTQVDAYAMGTKDKDTAIADFKASVHDLYSFLKVS
ncbi:MAG: hypothetical protein VB064_12760 [Oscillospiraceae bacterium]|nr:hypothetical protein [Oscillospiraceae bacterium]